MRLVDADAIIQKLPYSPEEMSITSILSQEKPKYITPTVMRVSSVISIIQNTLTATPWVKISDRLPTESNDTAGCGKVFVLIKRRYEPGYIIRMERVDYIIDHPEEFAYWMPVPPLPEVDTPFGFERIGGDWEETAE